MPFTVDVETKFIPENLFHAACDVAMTDWCEYSGEIVQQIARANVTEGIGPGPHPHPGREDTGSLREAVQFMVDELERYVWRAQVGPDKNAPALEGGTPPWLYGWFLEIGWHSLIGRFWRYPWLRPALLNSITWVRRDLDKMADKLARMLNRLSRRWK